MATAAAVVILDGTHEGHRRYVTRSTHNNIVPAAAAFDETFGFWGG